MRGGMEMSVSETLQENVNFDKFRIDQENCMMNVREKGKILKEGERNRYHEE